MNIREVKNGHRGHFFDKDTMRFFRSRVHEEVYSGPGGVFFVTSEQFDSHSPRLFTVRQYDVVTGDVDTHGEFQAYKSRHGAHSAAARAAAGKE